jgi:hypothetical protein
MSTTYQSTGGTAAGIGTRIALTFVGAAGLIVGAFLEWVAKIDGTKLEIRALWRTTFQSTNTFVSTVGFAMIVLALVALVGLAMGTGWLTRLAGAVAIIGLILFAIELYRQSGDETIGMGAWITLGGAIVTLVAGFFGPRQLITTPATTNVVVED